MNPFNKTWIVLFRLIVLTLALLSLPACVELLEEDDNVARILCIGNSITIHPVNDYWWGTWGMAASSRDSDWVHVLQSQLQRDCSGLECHAVNVTGCFERGNVTDIKRCIDECDIKDNKVSKELLSQYRLFIIRLGENVIDVESFQVRLRQLVTSIKKESPNAAIILTGSFLPNDETDYAIMDAAKSTDCRFVSLKECFCTDNLQEVGEKVYGDDGNIHVIENEGVANHPSDKGMKAIAGVLADAIRTYSLI